MTSAMGSVAPTTNAKILNAASLLMMHPIALRHGASKRRNFIREVRFCFCAHCRTPFCRALESSAWSGRLSADHLGAVARVQPGAELRASNSIARRTSTLPTAPTPAACAGQHCGGSRASSCHRARVICASISIANSAEGAPRPNCLRTARAELLVARRGVPQLPPAGGRARSFRSTILPIGRGPRDALTCAS